MVVRWNSYEIQLSCFMMLAVLYEIGECEAVNLEGLALLEFRERIEDDPYGAFLDWNLNRSEPCMWLGVHCVDGNVEMLNLDGYYLRGTLAPELRKLRYMKSLVLSNNRLSGSIPKEIGELRLLGLLDLSYNNLNGVVPSEIGGMPSLKCLCLLGNNFHGSIPPVAAKVDLCADLCHELRHRHSVAGKDCPYDKSDQSKLGNNHVCARGGKCCRLLAAGLDEDIVRRRLLEESRNNLAPPAKGPRPPVQDRPVLMSSGAFSAMVKHSPSRDFFDTIKRRYIIVTLILPIALLAILALICFRRRRGAGRPRDAGLIHQLSKALVTGVPKLNSAELEDACEDFSNIIDTFHGGIMYKGILSSGVEIAVVSTSIRSAKQWTKHADKEFKRKLDVLSKVNHKNFVNLLGYCEENDPFVRMMVFEYAPNGNLYEHLHEKDTEPLNWYMRMRVIMGTSYGLEHMHHEMNPPIILSNIQSDVICLTEDYSAKIVDSSVWSDIAAKSKIPDEEESKHYGRGFVPSNPTMKDNIFCFGILMLETISANCETVKKVSFVDWFRNHKEDITKLVDPTLESFNTEELLMIHEVASQCIHEDPRKRPSMREVTSKLRQVINISPEAATSRISPLWWAELEILSESG